MERLTARGVIVGVEQGATGAHHIKLVVNPDDVSALLLAGAFGRAVEIETADPDPTAVESALRRLVTAACSAASCFEDFQACHEDEREQAFKSLRDAMERLNYCAHQAEAVR